MRSSRIGVLALVLAALGAVPATGAMATETTEACTYEVTALPAPSGGSTPGTVTGTDGGGRFVGTAIGADGARHGVLWQDGKPTDLGRAFNPVDVNRAGQVIGWGAGGALLWQNGTTTALARPAGALGISAEGINDAGLIVGFGTYSGQTGNRGLYWQASEPAAVREIGSTADFLTDAGNDGRIVGGDRSGTVTKAVAGTTNGLAPLPGVDQARDSRADVIAGRFVLGRGFLPGQGYRTLLWENGVPSPAPVADFARSVNGSGVLVGDEPANGGYATRAFVQDGDVHTTLPLLPGQSQSRATVVTEAGAVGGVNVTVDIEGEHTIPVVWSCAS